MKSMQANEIKTENDIDSRIYEVGYLLSSKIEEGEVPAQYSNLKDLIATLGGAVIADEMPRMINLAYTIVKVVQNVRNKYDTAYFGWTKFEMEPEKVIELKKKLDLDPNFVRFLLVKTVRESTAAPKRFVNRDGIRRKPTPTGENEVVAPINKEEIDKEIDAMVAV